MKRSETTFPTEPSSCLHKLLEAQIYLCREVKKVFFKKKSRQAAVASPITFFLLARV